MKGLSFFYARFYHPNYLSKQVHKRGYLTKNIENSMNVGECKQQKY